MTKTMTTQDKTNLRRILLPLVAVLVGTLLTAAAFFLAGFASAACHCPRPIAVAFPYATIVWGTTQKQSLGGALLAFQFPVYALILALGKSRAIRARYAKILAGVHVLAVVIVWLVCKG